MWYATGTDRALRSCVLSGPAIQQFCDSAKWFCHLSFLYNVLVDWCVFVLTENSCLHLSFVYVCTHVHCIFFVLRFLQGIKK